MYFSHFTTSPPYGAFLGLCLYYLGVGILGVSRRDRADENTKQKLDLGPIQGSDTKRSRGKYQFEVLKLFPLSYLLYVKNGLYLVTVLTSTFSKAAFQEVAVRKIKYRYN